MYIYKPEIIDVNEENIKIQAYYESNTGNGYLWYLLPQTYKKYLTHEKLDAFLVALIFLAMKNGEDIYLKAPVSEKLFYNLSNNYIYVLNKLIPYLKRIKIFPDELHDGKEYTCENKIVTGFSGGVDSFHTIYEYFYNENVSNNFKLTHLIINNVGAYGEFESEKARNKFHKLYERLRNTPIAKDLNFIKIDSNINEVINLHFHLTHTTCNVSAILLLQKLFSKFYYAAGCKYENYFIGKTKDISCADPIILNLLSTETLECSSVGSQLSRIEKTAVIADFEKCFDYLNVCINNEHDTNCSACYKCNRTMLTLDLLGKLGNFKNAFDLKKYYKNKKLYIIKILADQNNRFTKEIKNLMKEKKFKVHFWQKLLTGIIRILPPKLFPRLSYFFYKHNTKRKL